MGTAADATTPHSEAPFEAPRVPALERPLRHLLERPAVHVVILLVLSVSWLFRDMDRPLTGDSVRYAAIARTFAERGSLLVPEMLGEPYFRKPPLGLWLPAGAIRLLGPTNHAAKLPSTIAAALTVVALYFVVSRLLDSLSGLAAGILLLFTPNFFRNSATCRFESLLLLAMLLALASLERARERPRYFAAFWALAGAAILTKSGLGTLPLAVVLIAAAARRDPFPFDRRGFYAGALCFLAVVGPWYAYMTWKFGSAFWSVHVGQEIVARLGEPHQGRLDSLLASLTYPGILLLLAPLGVYFAWRTPPGPQGAAVRRAALVGALWIGLVLAGQVANRSAFARYSFMMLAPAAGLAGAGAAALARRWLSPSRLAAAAGTAAVMLLVLQQLGVAIETKYSRVLRNMIAASRILLPAGRPVPVVARETEPAANFVFFHLGKQAEPLPLDRLEDAVSGRGGEFFAIADRGGLQAASRLAPELIANGHYYALVRFRPAAPNRPGPSGDAGR